MAYFEAFIAAIKLINQAIQGAKTLVAWVEANRNEKWFQDSIAIFNDASKAINKPAVTPEEKHAKSEALKSYSRGLSDLLSRV